MCFLDIRSNSTAIAGMCDSLHDACIYIGVLHTILLMHSHRGYEEVQMLLGSEPVQTWQPCRTLLHTVNATFSDEGRYTCRVRNSNGTLHEEPLGNMTVIGKLCDH